MARNTPRTNRASNIRIPPQNIESEKALLGSIMLRPEAIFDVTDIISPKSFYVGKHKLIYETMLELHSKKEPIDLLSLSSRFNEKKQLEIIGGRSYLTELISVVPSSTNIRHYAEILQKKFILRELINASDYICELGFNEESEIEDLLNQSEKRIFEITGLTSGTDFIKLKDTLAEAWERLDKLHKGETHTRGIPSGYPELDNLLSGFQKSDLIILASRPSMGKTTLALDIARKVGCDYNIPVAIFSLEMSSQQLVDRMLAAQSRVNAWQLRTGNLRNESDFTNIQIALDKLSQAPIFIDDQSSRTVLQMRSIARKLKREHNLQLLIIDYLQLIATSKSYDSMVHQITDISRNLKGLARELDIPVIALSQLSRAVEHRRDKPRLSDLRDSGCLTADTRIINAHTGELVTIKELAERKKQSSFPIFTINADYEIKICDMSKAFSSGKKEVFKLTMRSGRTIKASGNHPFLKIDGWKHLDKLAIGDRIAIPRAVTTLYPTNPLTKNELILLAHLLGDGCILPKQPYHYTNAYKENIETVRKVAKELFNIDGRIIRQKNWWHIYLSSPYHLTHGKKHPITLWFEKLGLERVRSYQKKVSPLVMECDEKRIALFVQHLWATDGNISWKKNKKKEATMASIYYATSSLELAYNLQHLLLRLKIQSTVRTISSKKGYRDIHNVYIEGSPQQLRFLEVVGSADRRKMIIPSLKKALRKIEYNPNVDTIPKEVWKFVINHAKEEQGMSWRDVQSSLGNAYNGSALFQNSIGRTRMTTLACVLNSPPCLKLAQSDVLWDKIVSIKSLGVEEVYDATVPGMHNFLANDIIVHNSIEQDADVVMFIHREDKYRDDDEKTNIAEILIEKHRNGPTGKIELFFDEKRTTFTSLQKDGTLDDTFSPDENKSDEF